MSFLTPDVGHCVRKALTTCLSVGITLRSLFFAVLIRIPPLPYIAVLVTPTSFPSFGVDGNLKLLVCFPQTDFLNS